jgi:hypothetical protein
MRINVYAEEVTSETEIIRKTVHTDEGTDETFYGVRFYLLSPKELHHSSDDDDRSAITLWVRWTKADGNNPLYLKELFSELYNRAYEITRELRREP